MTNDLDKAVEKQVELWRGMANGEGVPEANETTLRWCADELEELLDNHTDD